MKRKQSQSGARLRYALQLDKSSQKSRQSWSKKVPEELHFKNHKMKENQNIQLINSSMQNIKNFKHIF